MVFYMALNGRDDGIYKRNRTYVNLFDTRRMSGKSMVSGNPIENMYADPSIYSFL